MSDDLSNNYDVIVVGTGLVESIVAAAAARINKQVLHIDKNKYYGQHWATFNYEDMQQWIGDQQNEINLPSREAEGNLEYLATEESKRLITDVRQEWFGGVVTRPKDPPPKKPVEEGENKPQEPVDDAPIVETLTAEDVKARMASFSRKFNIDLAPKWLFFKGPMVDVLIKSKVSRYLEFLGVQNILLCVNGGIELVPCSKSDVFSTRTVSIVEKRLLMKLLTTLQSYKDDSDELKELENISFEEYLKQQNISETVQHYILYSIAMGTPETSAAKGIKQAQAFLNSIGFCGNTPFIWPMYGTCEIIQAFCRISAVYGGIYCLNRSADFLVKNEETCEGVYSNDALLKAKHVVVSTGLIPGCYVNRETPTESFQRAVLITNKPVFSGGKDGISLMTYPFLDSSLDPITLLELNRNTSSCPAGFFVVHLVSRKGKQKTPYEDFDKLISDVFQVSGDGDKPTILYKLLFTMEIISSTQCSSDLPGNIYPCSGPRCLSIDFHSSIQEAEAIFKKMYPDEEFLPTPETTEEGVSEE